MDNLELVLSWHCSLYVDMWYLLPFLRIEGFHVLSAQNNLICYYLKAEITAIIKPGQFISNSFLPVLNVSQTN